MLEQLLQLFRLFTGELFTRAAIRFRSRGLVGQRNDCAEYNNKNLHVEVKGLGRVLAEAGDDDRLILAVSVVTEKWFLIVRF